MVAEDSPLLEDVSATYLCFRSRQSAFNFTLGLLFLALFCKDGSNSLVPSTLPEIRHIVEGPMGILPALGAAGYALGKMFMILSIYFLGGRTTLVLASLFSAAGSFCVITMRSAWPSQSVDLQISH